MKSNLQYIFDKITRSAPATGEWDTLDKAALIDLIIAIGATDRGIAICAGKAAVVAETVLAARLAGPAELRQRRAALTTDGPSTESMPYAY